MCFPATASLQLADDPQLWHPTRGFAAIFRKAIAPYVRELYQHVADRRTDRTVVLTSVLGMGARVAQEHLGVPLITVNLQPAVLWSRYQSPALFGILPWYPGWLRQWLFDLGEAVRVGPAGVSGHQSVARGTGAAVRKTADSMVAIARLHFVSVSRMVRTAPARLAAPGAFDAVSIVERRGPRLAGPRCTAIFGRGAQADCVHARFGQLVWRALFSCGRGCMSSARLSRHVDVDDSSIIFRTTCRTGCGILPTLPSGSCCRGRPHSFTTVVWARPRRPWQLASRK